VCAQPLAKGRLSPRLQRTRTAPLATRLIVFAVASHVELGALLVNRIGGLIASRFASLAEQNPHLISVKLESFFGVDEVEVLCHTVQVLTDRSALPPVHPFQEKVSLLFGEICENHNSRGLRCRRSLYHTINLSKIRFAGVSFFATDGTA